MREWRAAADGAGLDAASLNPAGLDTAGLNPAGPNPAGLNPAGLDSVGLECAVLDWAASGAMALTGLPDGPPTATPAAALALLRAVTGQLAGLTRETGHEVRADAAELISGRAALAGFTRGGQVSAGGSCLLLRAADGWCAVNLSRPDDLAAVPAVVGALGLGPDGLDPDGLAGTALAGADGASSVELARLRLAAAARARPAADVAAAGQLLGVPASALPAGALPPGDLPPGDLPPRDLPPGGLPPGDLPPGDPGAGALDPGGRLWRTARIAPPLPGARLAGAVVADLSSMWAGPLCARLLGLAGADVIKVESLGRPDGARSGNREFFDWLHAGHRSLAVDFGSREGQAALAALLATADVVIEASRPRALAALGLAPGQLPHRDGQVWLSISGYGLEAPDLVAFGDDAAVAGGLVGWASGLADRATGPAGRAAGLSGPARADPVPVFCADAIADPLAGVCGALAVARSRAAGGGERIDLSMRDVAAAFAAAAVPGHGVHEFRPDGSVRCPRSDRAQAVLPPRRPAPSGRAAGLGADTAAVMAWLAGRPAC
jgi:crotonobetainyl-CoA:carnitine CoA-transferase CaiB-like acyl-CoA transferase